MFRYQKEIQGISVIDWQQSSWKRTTLLTDRAVQLSTAKINAFSDSVLGMCRISDNPVIAWKEKFFWFMNSSRCREMDRIDGRTNGARVEDFPRIHYIADSRRDPEHGDWNTGWTWAIPRANHLHVNVQRHCIERQRKQRIVYCEFPNRGRICNRIRARTFGRFLGLDQKRNGAELIRSSRTENGIHVAEDMTIKFSESGHPVFCGSRALERGA